MPMMSLTHLRKPHQCTWRGPFQSKAHHTSHTCTWWASPCCPSAEPQQTQPYITLSHNTTSIMCSHHPRHTTTASVLIAAALTCINACFTILPNATHTHTHAHVHAHTHMHMCTHTQTTHAHTCCLITCGHATFYPIYSNSIHSRLHLPKYVPSLIILD